jgi:acetylornithine deacetylase/succinyl-diaminopimelate desuccinylase-like protein
VSGALSVAEEEVVAICRDLIRIDTTNPGDHSGPGERKAAEYVAGLLSEVGLAPAVLESHQKRTSLVARVEGNDPSRPALLIHGHLDVVPANAIDWQQHPFGGEIADNCVWGRGAVDMKDMDAMVLAVIRQRLREGRKPDRDIVLAFTADEEAGGNWGAGFLVQQHPDFFEGVTEAIGEVGGFSVPVGDRRLYAVQTAEKGLAWMRLTATGTARHGSMIHTDNAVTKLTEAFARVGRHQWPTQLPDSTKLFLAQASEALGVEFDPQDPASIIGKLGGMSKMIGATTQHTANPTGLKAGYKVNVIPQTAVGEIDGRFLPGREEEFFAEIDRLLGTAISREFIHHDIALETTPDGHLWDAMSAALSAEDPDATVVPYCLSAGTDAKHFSRLGIRCFGFSPLRLPSELDFAGMFHGIDERVPLDSLQFGVRVLDRLLDIC